VKSLRSFTYTTAVAVLLSAGAVRAADESPFKFEFHGFITGSIYAQNQVFSPGSGQGLLFFGPSPANAAPCKAATCGAGTATKSDTFLGGDVRQSRFIFALTGPKEAAFGATPRAYFEGDLFGLPGAAPLVESWGWRIRAAFAELKWSQFTFQAGQHAAHLAFAQLPDSVSHIANPLSFGAGSFGWRTIDARGIYTVPMGANTFELAVNVAQPSWFNNNVPASGATPLTTIGAGEKGGIPQLEGRARLEGKSGSLGYNLYVDGLWQSVDLKGFGGATNPNGVTLADGTVKTSATMYAAEVGGRIVFAPAYVAFNYYNGKGLGSVAGALLQGGEIGENAFWVGAGVNLTKEFSLNATYGKTLLNKDDIRNWAPVYGAPGRKDNQLMHVQAKLLQGGFAFAAEYITYETTWMTGTLAAPGPDIKTDGWQIIGTAGYFF
jgi:hypothetical protein